MTFKTRSQYNRFITKQRKHVNMNFYRKHTYLIWQLIGWGLLLAAFIVMVVNLHDYHHDSVLGSFVFLTIFGTFAIFVSPLVIWLRKRDKAEQERNRCIMELNFKRHPAVEILAVILIFLIFLAATIVLARLGQFYLFPLAFYLAALPYCLFRYIVKKKFYQIPDAESFCQVFEVMEPEVLAYFEQTPTFVYFGIVPDEKTLRFLYNFYRKCGSLRQDRLSLVHVRCEMPNRRYGMLFPNGDEGFWCVTSEDVDVNKYTATCYYNRMTIYSGWIQALLQMREAAQNASQ